MGNWSRRSVSRSRRLSTDRCSKRDLARLSYAKGRWNRSVEFGRRTTCKYRLWGRGVYERCHSEKSGSCSASGFDPQFPIRVSLVKLEARLDRQTKTPPTSPHQGASATGTPQKACGRFAPTGSWPERGAGRKPLGGSFAERCKDLSIVGWSKAWNKET